MNFQNTPMFEKRKKKKKRGKERSARLTHGQTVDRCVGCGFADPHATTKAGNGFVDPRLLRVLLAFFIFLSDFFFIYL